MSNIYSDPSEFGLEIFGSIEKEPDYDFDMLVVWRDPKSREMFYAQDSGCSCPSPFEGYHDRASLTPVNRESFESFRSEVLSFRKEASEYGGSIEMSERLKLISTVQRHLPRKTTSP